MAIKKPALVENTVKEQVVDSLNELFSGDPESEETNPALESLFMEMGIEPTGEEIKVFVYQVDPANKLAEAQVWRGDPENYNLDEIGRTFGTGNYRVRIYGKANGKSTVIANKVFGIKLSPADEAKRLAPLNVPAQQAAPPVDIARAISEGIAAAMRSMPPPPPPMNLGEIIALAKAMMPAPVPQLNPMEMLKLGVEMSKSNNEGSSAREPGSNTNDLIIAMIENFAAPVVGLVTQAQQKVAQMPDAPGNLPALANEAAPAYTGELQQEETQDMNIVAEMKLKAGLSFLVTQAQQGNPCETYAEMIVDNVGAEDLQKVLAQPDPVAALCNFNKDIASYMPWFKELLDNVKNLLAEPPAEVV